MLRNVEQVVREEMVAIGAQEVHFPALIPREIFERAAVGPTTATPCSG